MFTPEDINELHRLDDDALVNTYEAAAVVGLSSHTLYWIRSNASHRGPKFRRIGPKLIRYRMGDLRAFISAREA